MGSLVEAATTGFFLIGGLIIAIGAQNAFLLKQGLQKANVPLLVTLAIIIDAAMLTVGTLGFGSAISGYPMLLTGISVAGAVFLLAYSALAFRRALRPGVLSVEGGEAIPARQAVKILLAVTLLNPHAFLDTIVLVGGIAGQFHGEARYAFLAGAILASAMWFTSLGFGARLLAPLFSTPRAWRVLDFGIGVVMLVIGLGLANSVIAAA